MVTKLQIEDINWWNSSRNLINKIKTRGKHSMFLSIYAFITCRVSSVLARLPSSVFPLRGSAPIFWPWAYSSVMSASGGGVTSGRGNGRTVGGATEGRPGTWLDRKCLSYVFATHFDKSSHDEKVLTCWFNRIMWPGTRNLPAVLIHTPAVSGLSITLDWAEKQFTEV